MNFIFLFHRKARLFFFNLFDSKRMFRSGKHRFRNFQRMTAQKKLLMNSPQWQLICLYLSDYQRNFVLYIITMKNFIDQPETLAHKTADKKTTTINSVKNHDIMKIAAISRHWDSLIQAQGYSSHYQEYLLGVFSK